MSVDVETMARETQIPVGKIKWAFDQLPSRNAATVEEARVFFEEADPDSDDGWAAFKRLDELCLRDIEKAQTIEEIKTVYLATPMGSKSERTAFKKWIELASTVEEITEIYNELIADDGRGGDVLPVIFRKWLNLSSTIRDLQELYNRVPESSEIEKETICKMATFFPK